MKIILRYTLTSEVYDYSSTPAYYTVRKEEEKKKKKRKRKNAPLPFGKARKT